MKSSFYNIAIKNSEYNNWLLFNTFSSSLLEVDKRIIDCLDDSEECQKLEALDNEELKMLKQYGFIVEDSQAEYQKTIENEDSFYKDKSKSDYISIAICPTFSCNMQCPYCYESEHCNSIGSGIMQKDVQENVLELYKRHCSQVVKSNKNSVDTIYWYGGEPLLLTEIINNTQGELNKIAAQYNRNIKCTLVTNGLLLTKETQEILKKNKIKFLQITVDGPKEIHNSRRYYPKSPNRSFDIIMENLSELDDYFSTSIRVNTDKQNAPYVEELLEEFERRKLFPYKKIGIYLAKVNCSTSCESETALSINEFYSMKENFRLNLVRTFNKISPSVKAKYEISYPNNKDIMGGCKYVFKDNTYIVGPDGDIFNCWKYVGDKKQTIGNIKMLNQGKVLNKSFQYNDVLKIRKELDCESCKYLPICSLSCPEAYIESGEINMMQLCCDWKSVLEDTILFNYDLLQKHPNEVVVKN